MERSKARRVVEPVARVGTIASHALATANAIWTVGDARSGKTEQLVKQFKSWQQEGTDSRTIFCFAANGQLRLALSRRLQEATEGAVVVRTFTPMGFFQAEVLLYWPLLQSQLGLLARFPLLLKPENEQELTEQLFAPELENGVLAVEGYNRWQVVRQILDNLQLAAAAGLPAAGIGDRLVQGRADGSKLATQSLQLAGQLANRFRERALSQGLLSYSLVAELYGQVLFPHTLYRQQLLQRCHSLLADDTDEYPALMADVFAFLLDAGLPARLTFSPTGAVRLGYGADPAALEALASRYRIETLSKPFALQADSDAVRLALNDPASLAWGTETIPLERVVLLQRSTRQQLLRAVATAAIALVREGSVQPQDVAIIGPGLDRVATYTLQTLLAAADLPIQLLDASQPLWTSPTVRALLALVALVYPHCGHLLSPEAIAELLVVSTRSEVDPVRAGLLSDGCFQPQPHQPQLLPSTRDRRRDRLGARASAAYDRLVHWVRQQQQAPRQSLPEFLDDALRYFWIDQPLTYGQVTAYRALLETAQRYEAVSQRLGQPTETVARSFYELLAAGTVTAKPDTSDLQPEGIVLGTIYQYRASHQAHDWQFWLDAGSSLWNSAYSSFGSFQLKNPYLYLRAWSGERWSSEQTQAVLDEQLQRVVDDLMRRCRSRIVLCHSDLSVTGSEASGPLLPVLDRAGWLEPLPTLAGV
jgi:hypothetical protein